MGQVYEYVWDTVQMFRHCIADSSSLTIALTPITSNKKCTFTLIALSTLLLNDDVISDLTIKINLKQFWQEIHLDRLFNEAKMQFNNWF